MYWPSGPKYVYSIPHIHRRHWLILLPYCQRGEPIKHRTHESLAQTLCLKVLSIAMDLAKIVFFFKGRGAEIFLWESFKVISATSYSNWQLGTELSMAHTAFVLHHTVQRLAKAQWRSLQSIPNGGANFFWSSFPFINWKGLNECPRLWNLC